MWGLTLKTLSATHVFLCLEHGSERVHFLSTSSGTGTHTWNRQFFLPFTVQSQVLQTPHILLCCLFLTSHSLLNQETHLTACFKCKFLIPNLKEKTSIWCIIMEDLGIVVASYISVMGCRAELPTSAAGSLKDWQTLRPLVISQTSYYAGMGAWEALFNNLSIPLAKIHRHSARIEGER